MWIVGVLRPQIDGPPKKRPTVNVAPGTGKPLRPSQKIEVVFETVQVLFV